MCKDCGCSEANKNYFDHKHDHDHDHDHHHHNRLSPTQGRQHIKLTQNILAKNEALAQKNRAWFAEQKMVVVNLMSSPGSGKTALLERTIEERNKKQEPLVVLVGDQQTDHDAQRLLDKGGVVKQINTQSSCHLDAQMIATELKSFVTGEEKLLIIENIGNLVCPAAFDLGESVRVALLSTTEGEDKPIKYPVLFHSADVVLITKTDLIPHLDWNHHKAIQYIKQVNAGVKIIEVSAKTGEGMDAWLEYLRTLTPKN